jgi:trehalose utilization protein
LHYGTKALAVQRAWSQLFERGEVLRSSITFVRGEAIAWIFAVEFTYAPVSIDLGND